MGKGFLEKVDPGMKWFDALLLHVEAVLEVEGKIFKSNLVHKGKWYNINK